MARLAHAGTPVRLMGMPRVATGILNNELYVGELAWNCLRYVKNPDTGRRQCPQTAWFQDSRSAARVAAVRPHVPQSAVVLRRQRQTSAHDADEGRSPSLFPGLFSWTARYFLAATIFVTRPTLVSPAYRLSCLSMVQ
jgi:hypothetical protein